MSLLFQANAFITYWLDAVESYSLHSPFLFDFYNHVVAGSKRDVNSFNIPEDIRQKMLQSQEKITIADLGSGSRYNGTPTRSVSYIARTSTSPSHRSRFLSKMVNYFNCEEVIELGTSLGINTLYLANGGAHVCTFEGAGEIAKIARANFREAGAYNIELIEGDIAATLPRYLQRHPRIDFAFIDANHRFQPTMEYYRLLKPALHAGSVVVLDDIHYHADMQRAWEALRNDESVSVSADLFRHGILFFDPSLNKQHVVLQY